MALTLCFLRKGVITQDQFVSFMKQAQRQQHSLWVVFLTVLPICNKLLIHDFNGFTCSHIIKTSKSQKLFQQFLFSWVLFHMRLYLDELL